jgi:hypothetical protein
LKKGDSIKASSLDHNEKELHRVKSADTTASKIGAVELFVEALENVITSAINSQQSQPDVSQRLGVSHTRFAFVLSRKPAAVCLTSHGGRLIFSHDPIDDQATLLLAMSL